MLHAGLDLSRRRLDLLPARSRPASASRSARSAPDADGLRGFARRVEQRYRARPRCAAAIESMTGARFVHDQLELCGWDVANGDAVKVKELAPLAPRPTGSTPESSRSSPDGTSSPRSGCRLRVRAERERARFRLHLVRHRTALKNRIHATLISFGHVPDGGPLRGRRPGAPRATDVPEPWRARARRARDGRRARPPDRRRERDLRALGADHPAIPLLMTVPGIAWVLAYTIASEIGDIRRFARRKAGRLHRTLPEGPPVWRDGAAGRSRRTAPVPALGAHRGRHPRPRAPRLPGALRADQAGGSAASAAPRSPGSTLARKLAEAIWHVLTKNEPFAPAGPAIGLVA